MTERKVQVPIHGGGVKILVASAGVPQGSVLGPTLWNILYDDMLRLNRPPGVNVVAYADDVVLIASNPFVPELETTVGTAIDTISS